ncbi:MAG: polysaccharide pyruvyl transferase family protein [Clostridia bacterium]|nr:polysaccharide pyruvyl transferase family protein [Clostridia bacterium]
MNRKLKEVEYQIKSEIMAEFFAEKVPDFDKYAGVKKFYVFLCGYYQNLGDMALTYAHEKFLRDNFPDYEVIMVAGYKTYPWMKELQRILTKDDIITILGGGNMDDLYVSLENARRFVIRKFPNNPVVSFPQTMGFTDTAYGRMRKKKTIKTYNKNKNLKIFTREPKSLAMMKESFNSEIGFVPDMVLYLNKTEPKQERDGVLCVLRSDREMHLSDAESENIKSILRERYGNVEFTDTVNVTEDECKPENLKDTLERFWAMLRTKKVVVTDRLHCMIFCAITKTPCVVFDNSNNKTSGVFNSWLKDYGYIRMCGSFDCDKMLKNVDELLEINLDECRDHDLSNEFAPLINHIKSKTK